MSDEPYPYHTVREKVDGIFRAFGERANRLKGVATASQEAIEAALSPEYGKAQAWEIAFHMSDWNSDAAFITALHLFPERFTAEEIRAGIGLFLGHAPNHIRAACGLTGDCQWVDFYESDEGESGGTV